MRQGPESSPKKPAAKADYPPKPEKIGFKEAEQLVMNGIKERKLLERVRNAHQEARLAAGEANKKSFFKGGTPLQNPLIKEMVRLGELAQIVEYLSTKSKAEWKIPIERHLREGESKDKRGPLTVAADLIGGENPLHRRGARKMLRKDYEEFLSDIEKHAVFHEDLSAGPDNSFLSEYPELYKKFIVTKTKKENPKAERVIDISPKTRLSGVEESEPLGRSSGRFLTRKGPAQPEGKPLKEIDLGRMMYEPLPEATQQEPEGNVHRLPSDAQPERYTGEKYETERTLLENKVLDAIQNYEEKGLPMRDLSAAILEYREFLMQHNPEEYKRQRQSLAVLEGTFAEDTPKSRAAYKRWKRKQDSLDARDIAAEKRNTPARRRSASAKAVVAGLGLLVLEMTGLALAENAVRHEEKSMRGPDESGNRAPRMSFEDLERELREDLSRIETPAPDITASTKNMPPMGTEDWNGVGGPDEGPNP